MTRRRSQLGTWLWELRYKVGPNLWAIPFVMALTTLVLFAVTRQLDRRWAASDAGVPGFLPEWLVARSAADADVVLSAMLSALATSLSLVFSISVLTFSLASSQLGPRLIRRFMLDPVTQVTLGAFLSAIVMCALTLSLVTTDRSRSALPSVSYATAFVMGLGTFFLLIVYVHRVATTIQAPRVVSSVVRDLGRTMQAVNDYLPEVIRSSDAGGVAALRDRAVSDGALLVAERTGYFQAFDHPRVLDATEAHDAVVVLVHRVGQFLVAGQPLGYVLPPSQADQVRRALHEAVEIGDARTIEQDIEFALNQVVEIALRALSPAVNDTFTGRTCVDWLGDALRQVGQRPDPTGGLCGDRGEVRLVEPPLRFHRLLRNGFDAIRQSASANPAITLRMFDSLVLLVQTVESSHVAAVAEYAEVLRESATASSLAAQDATDVQERYERVLQAVAVRNSSS
ncbi:MAG: DUF2254 domain-containing protein [Actinomycetes bacterium]